MAMISKEHIERVLRMNGLKPTASDEEIKSLLISAKWHEEDAELAVTVLRENKETHKTHVDTLHKVFTSDDRLDPESISSLLGIDVELNSNDINCLRDQKQTIAMSQIVGIVGMAVAMAFLAIMFLMWNQDMDLLSVL